MKRSTRYVWQYRSYHRARARVLLRPICLLWGHRPQLSFVAVFVGEGALKPVATVCDRCGKQGP